MPEMNMGMPGVRKHIVGVAENGPGKNNSVKT
jgi:hypothetical protein